MDSRQFSKKRVSGHFPQCGAIFMADNTTRKECFQIKIFGLPSAFAKFVNKIKCGMWLFLFDYQDKKLYGVFKAISDGGLNIVPHAYRSSKKQFPAQVRFSVLWRCAPLPVEVFRDAIGENYFAPHKFNFGLSKDQVERLLVLFETRRIRTQISWNLSRKRKRQIGCDESNSEVESKPDSDENSESFSEKSASLEISQNGNAADLDDCKPQPSVDAKEVENSSRDGLAGEDFIPLPAIDLEESKDPLPDGLAESPLRLFASQHEYDALQSAIDSLFSELGGCPLQEEREPQGCDGRESDKQNDGGPHCRVNGLYSDSPQERTSVFRRLSGLSKVMNKETSCHHDKIGSSSGTFGRFANDQDSWKNVSSQYHDPKPSNKRKSVFSRLSCNVGPALKKTLGERMPAEESKCLALPEGLPAKKPKNDTTETLCEVQVSCAAREKQFKSNERVRTSENSWETKVSDLSSTGVSSTGPVLPSGISASTVNCESCDTIRKSDEGSSEVASEESKVCDTTCPDKSYQESATKTMMNMFRPSPSASSGFEEVSKKASVSVNATEVNPKSSADGSHESELEFLSMNVDASTEVWPSITEQNENVQPT